jgi:ATP-dependent DNA helicase RecQ
MNLESSIVMDDAGLLSLLKQYWGYEAFRPLQRDIIGSIVTGESTLSVMPTGGGKSLCYQLPALQIKGTAVVISPLIALMKDQVDRLCELGIRAAYINSSLAEAERKKIIAQTWAGEFDLLYMAPETFQTEYVRSMLTSVDVSYFVVDEAHCISHWGHDFRPAYKQLALIKKLFPGKAVHAFTATATPSVSQDIVSLLYDKQPCSRVAPVDRTNLTYTVKPRRKKMEQLREVLDRHQGEPGIVYCLTRNEVEEVTAALNAMGYDAVAYHAGFSDELRRKHQELFVNEERNIMVATIAFGMGVDRSNIRWIAHLGMPKTLEHYQQETGRAGRDGLPASCYLFYGGNDYYLHKKWIEDSTNRDVMTQKLDQMYTFCQTCGCRHKRISEYFGQKYDTQNCGACDYCQGDYEVHNDSAEIAAKIATCVEELCRWSGYGFGAAYVADVLCGADTQRLRDNGHTALSSYGCLSDCSRAFVRDALELMVLEDVLERSEEYKALTPGYRAEEALDGSLEIRFSAERKQMKKETPTRFRQSLEQDTDAALFEILRKTRRELARGKPAYHVFSDRTLAHMAALKPVNAAEFMEVSGVGEQKCRQYAQAFTTVIREYLRCSAD